MTLKCVRDSAHLMMFSSYREEMPYIFLENNFIFMVYLAIIKMLELMPFKAMQMRFLLFQATKMT